MPVELEGGCRVVGLKEGEPLTLRKVRIWQHFQSKLSLRVIELDGRATFKNDGHDEVLYDLEHNVGIYIPVGKSVKLEGPATFVSALTPAEASNRNAAIVHLETTDQRRATLLSRADSGEVTSSSDRFRQACTDTSIL